MKRVTVQNFENRHLRPPITTWSLQNALSNFSWGAIAIATTPPPIRVPFSGTNTPLLSSLADLKLCSRVFAALVSQNHKTHKRLKGSVFGVQFVQFLLALAEANNSNKDKVAQPSITSMQNQQNPELNHWLSLGGVFTERPAEDCLARFSSSAGALEQAASDPSQLAGSSFVPAEPGQWLMRHKDTRALRRLEAKKKVAERRAEEAAAAASLQEKRMPPPAAPATPPIEVTRASSSAIYKYRVEGYLSVSTAPNGARSASGMTSRFQAVLVESNIKPVLASSERAKASNRKAGDNDGEAAIAKMPRVRTVGAGGRMIEGNLHRYHQGHVSIKCVCHGSFHSPAEFVKHAGGSEVANPLKHITVVCSPSD